MGDPVIHFVVGCTDAQRSRQFYEDLFGWQITDESGDGMVDTRSDQGIGGAC
jgi:predicted enzyme related to lactoylglutathione lyase